MNHRGQVIRRIASPDVSNRVFEVPGAGVERLRFLGCLLRVGGWEILRCRGVLPVSRSALVLDAACSDVTFVFA